jgi:hypothetical protein
MVNILSVIPMIDLGTAVAKNGQFTLHSALPCDTALTCIVEILSFLNLHHFVELHMLFLSPLLGLLLLLLLEIGPLAVQVVLLSISIVNSHKHLSKMLLPTGLTTINSDNFPLFDFEVNFL